MKVRNMEDTVATEKREEISISTSKKGGWITFPFFAGTLAGLTLGVGGWAPNLVVYMIEKFHIESINATQYFNIVSSLTSLSPVIIAILTDTCFRCYSVIWLSILVSALGVTLMALTATLDVMSPKPCVNIGSNLCEKPSPVQYLVLFLGIGLASAGLAGTRFTIATMGASQFDAPKDQASFFNWFSVIVYSSTVLGGTFLVYMEENISWGLGFGLCTVANIIALVVYLLGSRFYRHFDPKGGPYKRIVSVFVAAFRKWNVDISSGMTQVFYHDKNRDVETGASVLTKSFRFFNRAALQTEGDTKPDGSIANQWRLCSVQQVEDLKILLRIIPIVSSAITLCTTVPIQATLTILQALTVDRHLGPHFKIPVGSLSMLILTTTAITLVFIDRYFNRIWQKIFRKPPRTLQRIALGHIFNMAGLSVSALVESKRLKLFHEPNHAPPMLVVWLMPQLILVGIGEAFHYPGQVTFYYQEFPKSLRSTSTAMISLAVGLAYLLSAGVINMVRRTTVWLPNDINAGRLDYVFWLFAGMLMMNFCYFLICAMFYKYRDVEKTIDSSTTSNQSDL